MGWISQLKFTVEYEKLIHKFTVQTYFVLYQSTNFEVKMLLALTHRMLAQQKSHPRLSECCWHRRKITHETARRAD
jgi:hypothetical protein